MHGLTGMGDVTGLVILLRTESNGQKASCGVAVKKMAQPRDVRLEDILRRLSQRSVHGTSMVAGGLVGIKVWWNGKCLLWRPYIPERSIRQILGVDLYLKCSFNT